MAKKTAKKASKKVMKKAAKKVAKKAVKTVTKKTAKAPRKVASKTKLKAKPKTTVGQIISDFALPSTAGEDFKLSNLKGKAIVLYFYPKDDTPGCTLEGSDFTRLHSSFKNLNADVFGVSRDSIKSHNKFREKQGYSVNLLSDEDEKLCKIFDVIKEKNMYGKKVMGIERSTFVLDGNGRLIKEWRGVKVPGHADEVLSFVKTMPAYS